MSDNYEFTKSSIPQAIDDYSPYIDKQSNNYINDINGGVYTNNSLSLVTFDLGQIYNSSTFTDTNDLTLIIPVTMVAAFANAGNPVAASPGGAALLSLKNNFVNLIHQGDLVVQGKTVESTQPFINVARNFQMLSEMSINDLRQLGPTLGFSESLDNHRSMVYSAAGGAASRSGVGITNNRPYMNTNATIAGGLGGFETQISYATKQNNGVVNTALQQRISRYVDVNSANTVNNIVPTILSVNNLNTEFKPYYVQSGTYMIYYDYAVIKLNTIFDSLAKIGLVKRFDATIRLWLNTGAIAVNVTNANTALDLSYNNTLNTFSNTCPFTINYLDVASGVTGGTTHIVAGLFINKPPTTSLSGINLALSNASHNMPACRIYYSQIVIEPQKAINYISENRNKKVVFKTFISNQYNNPASAGGNFNALINSGIVHPTGILLVPYISSTVSSGLGDYAWKSPFDTAPSTGHPISLTNLQVTVGGKNTLQTTMFYTFEHFMQQVARAESLTSSDFGITTGLFGQSWWEYNRFYYVNIERSAIADKLQPRNINVSFTNNSAVAIDLLVFIFYSDELNINVETGIVQK